MDSNLPNLLSFICMSESASQTHGRQYLFQHLFHLVSYKKFVWIVCPHGITVTSFLDSNKNYNRHFRIVCWQESILQDNKNKRKKESNYLSYLKANRTIMMHYTLYTRVAILQQNWVAATYTITKKGNKIYKISY